ncbi:toprim domain-containing protein [Actinomadura fulvescens]
MTDAHRIFVEALPASWVPSFLSGRGFDAAAVRHWQIGYATKDAHWLTEQLRALGHSDDHILTVGLARRGKDGNLHDLFRDRLILAIRDAEGAVRGFIGRRTDQATGPKYLNTPATPLFHKSELLFGLHEMREALAQGARPTLTEGPLDAIAINIARPAAHAAIALCGTAITTAHLDLLAAHANLDKTGVVLAFDGDHAGQAAAVRAQPVLTQVKGPVTAVLFPKDQDPADILRHQGRTGIRQALQADIDLSELIIDLALQGNETKLQFPEGRVAAARAAAKVIATASSLHAARHVAMLSSRLDMPVELINQILIETITAGIPGHDAPGSQAPRLADEDFPDPSPTAPTAGAGTSPRPSSDKRHHRPSQGPRRRTP